MKLLNHFIAIFSFMLICFAPGITNAKTEKVKLPANLSQAHDYTYMGVGGERNIKVFFPKNLKSSDKRTALIFFHGGGWSGGSYGQGKSYCEYFATQGMVTMSAQYTLTSSKELKKQGFSRKRHGVIDAKTVVRWAKFNADALGFDPDKIVICGVSAGGHIGLVQAFNTVLENPNEPKEFKKFSNDIAAAVLMTAAFTKKHQTGIESSPKELVRIHEYMDKKFPPTLHFIGEKDGWGPQSIELVKDLAALKQPVEAWLGEGAGHNFIVSNKGGGQYFAIQKMTAFLKKLNLLEGEMAFPETKLKFIPELIISTMKK